MFFFQRRANNRFLPEKLSGLAIQAQQHAVLTVEQRGYGENAIAPDYGRGMAVAGNFGFPDGVAGRAPVHRHRHFRTGAVAARAAPGRPVFRGDKIQRSDQPQAG